MPRLETVRDTVMVSAGSATIFTLHSALNEPAVAVMVAVPKALAVTTPLCTEATLSSEELQRTVLSVAFSGVTTAISVTVSPTFISSSLWLREIPVTSTISVPSVRISFAASAPSGSSVRLCAFFHAQPVTPGQSATLVSVLK